MERHIELLGVIAGIPLFCYMLQLVVEFLKAGTAYFKFRIPDTPQKVKRERTPSSFDLG